MDEGALRSKPLPTYAAMTIGKHGIGVRLELASTFDRLCDRILFRFRYGFYLTNELQVAHR